MKTFIVLIASVALLNNASAQSTGDILKEQAKEGVKEGAAIATEHTADKVADKLLNSIFNKKNKKKKGKSNQATDTSINNANGNVATNTSAKNTYEKNNSSASIETYSKYDFVPGEKVLLYEDFSQDAIGDYPENWNTNSSGETVTVSGQTGHWLMLSKKGSFLQEDIKALPDNFTYQFDYISSFGAPFEMRPTLSLYLLASEKGTTVMNNGIGQSSGVDLEFDRSTRDKGGRVMIRCYDGGNKTIDNQVTFSNNGEEEIKVSIWRQKQRMRVYINQDKVLDLPRAFPAGKNYNTVLYNIWEDMNPNDKLVIGNIKLAVGDPDTRNKLITEGKFSTTGILFDVNSANVKPESYGTLKDIAGVLQDNSTVHVKIIGHTDADGDASANLALSKKRAEAVKSALVNEFKIDASRLETDGKGESDPVGDNKTAEGKAQNRRVEFVKM